MRGYDDYEVPADIGLFLRNEIRTKAISLLASETDRGRDRFSALVFTDYGVAASKQRLPGEPVSHLWSAGLGMRYEIASYLDVRFDYGWQLKNVAFSAVGAGRAHFGIVVSY